MFSIRIVIAVIIFSAILVICPIITMLLLILLVLLFVCFYFFKSYRVTYHSIKVPKLRRIFANQVGTERKQCKTCLTHALTVYSIKTRRQCTGVPWHRDRAQEPGDRSRTNGSTGTGELQARNTNILPLRSGVVVRAFRGFLRPCGQAAFRIPRNWPEPGPPGFYNTGQMAPSQSVDWGSH